MNYRLRSLVVGIDEYADPRYRETARLRYAKNDAQSIADTLCASTAFQLEADNPYLLTNQKASADEVRRVMNALFSPERPNRKTIALFYFAGHGVLKDGHIFLCCHDVDFAYPERSGIDLQQIYHWLSTSGAACTIAILDSCFSGGITNNTQKSSAIAEQVRGAIVDPHAPDGKTMAIFAACQSDQQAREVPQLAHGLFTYHILRGWQDGETRDPDGIVTLSGLNNYLEYQFKHEQQQPKRVTVGNSRIPLWKPPEASVPLQPPGRASQRDTTPRLPELPAYPVSRGHPIPDFALHPSHDRQIAQHNVIKPFDLGDSVPFEPHSLRRKFRIALGILVALFILFIIVMKLHGG